MSKESVIYPPSCDEREILDTLSDKTVHQIKVFTKPSPSLMLSWFALRFLMVITDDKLNHVKKDRTANIVDAESLTHKVNG